MKTLRFLRQPGQVTPLVVVKTRHYLALAHTFPAIAKSLALRAGNRDFLFQANDERGVPFLAVTRNCSWVRSGPLGSAFG